MPRVNWDKPLILKTLRQEHRAGHDLSYNALSQRQQSLVSAAAYHFGSYRGAVEKAGIEYAAVTRRPRWSKQTIIKLIKEARRGGEDLHWSAVTRRRDELGLAAFASLQSRLFGRWDRALQAAGLDADDVSQYRRWDRNTIVYELKHRARDGDPLNSGAIQKEDPGLHAAAVRHFGTYDASLRAAKLEPSRFRQRRRWEKDDVVRELSGILGKGQDLSSSNVRTHNAALYGAASRLFGTFTAARKAAERGNKRGGDKGKG